jgi:hypothetical protein
MIPNPSELMMQISTSMPNALFFTIDNRRQI